MIALLIVVGAGFGIWISLVDWRKPVYFLFEFEGIVGGEPFSVRSRVPCNPVTRGTDRLFFEQVKSFRMPRISFGQKLTTGEGAFVAVPDVCDWYYKKSKDSLTWHGNQPTQHVQPIVYITDRYENPTIVRLFADPNGWDNYPEVRVFKSTAVPLIGMSYSRFTEIPANPQDPFLQNRGSSWTVIGFLPLDSKYTDLISEYLDNLIASDREFEIFIVEEDLYKYSPRVSFSSYWTRLWNNPPVNEVVHQVPRYGSTREKERYRNDIDLALKIYPKIHSLSFGVETVAISSGSRGLILYPNGKDGFVNSKFQSRHNYEAMKIGELIVPINYSKLKNVVIRDKNSEEIFLNTVLAFGLSN